MEVLKAICTNAEDMFKDNPDYLDDLPLKVICNKADPIKIEDSDSEDEEDVKGRQFGSHIAAFQFNTDGVKAVSYDEHKAAPVAKVVSLSPEFKRPMTKREEAAQLLPNLCESIMPILRGFPNCPICLKPFPILSVTGSTRETNSKRKKKKKAVMRNAVTGAARLQHVRVCASRMQISSDSVTSLIKREKIRLDRNTRQEYSEKVNNQPLWKTLTGDEPPNTQAQIAATTRKRKSKKAIEEALAVTPAKKSKAKATSNSSPAVFKAGKRGGLSRASTTILPPNSTRAQIKANCSKLFGPPEMTIKAESYQEILSDYVQIEEGTARSRKAAQGGLIILGLEMGVCSREMMNANQDSSPRLGMGYSLGSIIAQRYKALD